MKTCPTCRTNVFDDMSVCYSCLFRFDDANDLDADFLEIEDAPAPQTPTTLAPTPLPAHAKSLRPIPRFADKTIEPRIAAEAPPSSPDHRSPQPNDWLIRLEIRNTDNPQQIWSMELNPANWPTPEAA